MTRFVGTNTLYRDVKIGVAAPLDELYILDVDAMIITLYEDGIVQRQVRVVRLRGTRRVGRSRAG